MMQPTISSVFNRNQLMAIAVVKPSSWRENSIVVKFELFKISLR